MRRLGTVEKIVTARNPFLDNLGWDGRPIRTDRPSVPIEVTFPRRSITLGTWVLLLTNAADAPPPVSRGSAWRDGAYAACQHQLTGLPQPVTTGYRLASSLPPLPRWYLDWLVWQMRRAYAEHYELFDPRAWTTGNWDTDLTASQLAEQRPDTLHLYDRNWNIATEPGAAVHAPPRTVARDYPPPAEPCKECIAFGMTWRDRLRALYDAFLATQQPVRPAVRVDFMPRYPGR